MWTRRETLKTAATLPLGLALGLGSTKAATSELGLPPGAPSGPPAPFSFDRLIDRARLLAAAPYEPPVTSAGAILQTIDYDLHQKIKIRPERGLWTDGTGTFAVELFHPARFFQAPVSIHIVSEGVAHEVLYSPDYFDYGDTGLASKLPDDLGFAGLRVMAPNREESDWLVFLGAAYFRSSGALNQYGQSARGVAIDTGLSTPEEFPRFSEFYIEQAHGASDTIVIHTLLDGPSLSGAYRFTCTRGDGVVTEVDSALFVREDIERLGIAPLTSMFWFGEHNRHRAADWRPEIHDTDGLALWNGAGERLWRPLNNPPAASTNAFIDENPRGFGLQQRDRAFHNYEDDGVFYERRPSVWVEPMGPWGKGAVQLVELPTDDEIYDNIVAFWVPEKPAVAGSQWRFKYKLHWLEDEPYTPDIGRVMHVRLGKGGIPGQPRPPGRRKIVIDFSGGLLEKLKKLDEVKPVIDTSRGTIDNDYALQVVGTHNWRAFFDIDVHGEEPVNIRCYLRLDGKTLTETCLFQYLPFSYG